MCGGARSSCLVGWETVSAGPSFILQSQPALTLGVAYLRGSARFRKLTQMALWIVATVLACGLHWSMTVRRPVSTLCRRAVHGCEVLGLVDMTRSVVYWFSRFPFRSCLCTNEFVCPVPRGSRHRPVGASLIHTQSRLHLLSDKIPQSPTHFLFGAENLSSGPGDPPTA